MEENQLLPQTYNTHWIENPAWNIPAGQVNVVPPPAPIYEGPPPAIDTMAERADAIERSENVHIECLSCHRSTMLLSMMVDYAMEGAVFTCEHCGLSIADEVARAREIRRHAIRTAPPIPAPLTRSFAPTELPNHVRDALELIERWTSQNCTGHWVMGGIQKRTFHRSQFRGSAVDMPMQVDQDSGQAEQSPPF